MNYKEKAKIWLDSNVWKNDSGFIREDQFRSYKADELQILINALLDSIMTENRKD